MSRAKSIVVNIVWFSFLYCQCYTQYHTSFNTYWLYQMAVVHCKFHCCHGSTHWNAIIFIARSHALITASNLLWFLKPSVDINDNEYNSNEYWLPAWFCLKYECNDWNNSYPLPAFVILLLARFLYMLIDTLYHKMTKICTLNHTLCSQNYIVALFCNVIIIFAKFCMYTFLYVMYTCLV